MKNKKYDHTKAQDFCNRVDPKGNTYKLIIEEMQKSFMLPDFVRRVGTELSHKVTTNEDLKGYFVLAAEALYKGLKEDTLVKERLKTSYKQLANADDDQLFGMVLNNLYYSLDDNNDEYIMGHLNSIYETN